MPTRDCGTGSHGPRRPLPGAGVQTALKPTGKDPKTFDCKEITHTAVPESNLLALPSVAQAALLLCEQKALEQEPLLQGPGLCGTERGPGPKQSCDVSIETSREIAEKSIPAWSPWAAHTPCLAPGAAARAWARPQGCF